MGEAQMWQHMERSKKCRGCDKDAETSVEDCEKFKVYYIGLETKEWWKKLKGKSNGELMEKIKMIDEK